MKVWRNSRRTVSMSVLALTLAGLVVVSVSGLFPRRVQATQPPPPSNYILTIVQSGGDDHCKIHTSPTGYPGDHPYPYAEMYAGGTDIRPYATRDCPCDRNFDHWECSNLTVQNDLNNPFNSHTMHMPIRNTTITAVYETVPDVAEIGTILTVMAGGVYGANVMYVYLNAAGYTLRENVSFGTPDPLLCECHPTRTIHQRDQPIPLVRCDSLGNEDPNGEHGMMGDQVVNVNGAPATLPGKGISLPCASFTDQDICIGNGCMEWVFHHSHQIYVYQTANSSPPSGYVRVVISNVGSGQMNW